MICKVLQWNVWYRERAHNILTTLQEIDADIVCLQELTTDSFRNPVVDLPAAIAKLGYEFRYVPTLKRTGDQFYSMGNGIFTKLPITAARQHYLQRESGPRENRLYLEVAVAAPGSPLYIGTTHFSWTPDGAMNEADRLADFIKGRRERFIFTGDLNVIPGSPVLERLPKHLTSVTANRSLPTWPTKTYRYHGVSIQRLDRQLDYIFTTTDIKVQASRTFNSPYSDHLPLLAEVAL